jgi:hypothetical protein
MIKPNYFFRRLAGNLPGVLLWLAVLPLAALGQTNVVFAPDSTYYGTTYPQWLAAWDQWCFSLETIHNPLCDTADLSAGQSGPVWFLGPRVDPIITTTRTGVVPEGTALFVLLNQVEEDNTGCPPTSYSEAQLSSMAQSVFDNAYDFFCTIDGVGVQDLSTSYRFLSPTYTYVAPPNNNCLELSGSEGGAGEPCYNDHSATPTPWTVTGAIADGVCVMLAPLALGPHTIYFGNEGENGYPEENVTYNITVVDTNLNNPGVFPPDSAPYGNTYAQWSANYWNWLYSLPANANPLFGTADLSAGQSGSVWFLGGAYTYGVLGGTAVRSGTIPDGTALFVPLINWESAKAEGKGTSYGQLFANSQFMLDHATNLSFMIDGQAVQNIEHYRAQSALFTWGPLPSDNFFGDSVKFPAGLTSQSVADGYYVMLTPLSLGTHTLQFTGGIKTSIANGDPSNFESQLDITYNLTVTPASLSVMHQGTNAVISWPQTGTSYLLEETASLSPANWSPSGASIVPVKGAYQATVPMSSGSQFFRLQVQ